MRPLVLSLLLGIPLLLTACGSENGGDEDPCRGVVCLRGQDCVNGRCIDRVEPEPEGCQSNHDCLFDPMGELCDRASGRCVACFTNAHCPEGRVCDAGQCAGSVCTTDDDCGADAPFCNEAGTACLVCLSDEHCEDGHRCEQGACEPPPPACEEDRDCEDPGAPFCVEGACVACTADLHCGEGEACSDEGSCLPNLCEDDADCAAFEGRTCRDGSCRPGECDTASDCPGERPYCEENACVVCTGHEGCGVGEICVGGTTCEPANCEGLMDCPLGSICEDGGCVPADTCVDASDCRDPRVPLCVDGKCAACGSNLDCGPWEQCRDGVCQPFHTCSADAGCAGGFVCEAGACVACRTDAQCARGVCRGGACVDALDCGSDVDCARGVCLAGSCVECAGDSDCREGTFCEAGSCVAGPDCGEGRRCPPGEICEEGSCVPSDCVDDAFEPDQGPEGARPLALRSVASRTICPGDEDWFVFHAVEGAMMEVSLLAGPEDLDLALVWFGDADERPRFERRGSGGMIAGPLPAAHGGRYFVRVRAEEAADYSLIVQPATGCVDGLEPNDTVNEAAPLAPGRLYEGLRPCNQDHYALELPAGMRAHFFAFYDPAEGQMNLQVFHGGTGIPLPSVEVSERGGGRVLRIPAAGTDRTLTFRVSAQGAGLRHYGVYVAVEEAAACEEGEALFSTSDGKRFRLQGTTAGSELSVDTPCGEFRNARTYRVELDEEQRLLVELVADYPGARLALLDASCASDLYCHEGDEAGSFLDIAGLPSGSYVLAVGAGETVGGWYDLSLRMEAPLAAPTNDRCEDAIDLDLEAVPTVVGTTLGARSDYLAVCENPSPDVFYRFELMETSRVLFDLRSTTPHALVLIEDACDDPHRGSCWSDVQRELELPAGTYHLGVFASSGRGGDFELAVRIVETPANDRCADAIPILSSAPIAGDTTWGHDDSSYPLGQSCTGYFLDGNDVFYSIALEQGESIKVTVEPEPDYDVAVYVRQGCEAGAACLAGADAALRGGKEEFSFTAPQTGTYLIVVDGARGGGSFVLTVE